MIYVVLVTPRFDVSQNAITSVLNAAHSWYQSSGWRMICTNEPATVWEQRLLPLVEPDGSMFIARLDSNMDREGWMKKRFWLWMREHGSCGEKLVPDGLGLWEYLKDDHLV